MSTKILLLEDDPLFGETISEFLEEHAFSVTHHLNAEDATQESFENNFDLFILDNMLPTTSGIAWLEEAREAQINTPAIFLTSSTQKETLMKAFSAGAEDFLTKPVDLDVLLIRIKTLLKRVYGSNRLHFGNFSFDQEQSQLYKGDEPLYLKPKPLALLKLFLQNRNKLVTHEMIEYALYTASQTPSSSAVRVYITEIKHLIGEAYISNIRGLGYRFNA